MEKAVITCGGTGGHFYPGLAIARQLQKEHGEVLLLLSGIHSQAQQQIAQQFGVPAEVLPEMPSPGKSPRRWWKFLTGLSGGFFQARQTLRQFEPQFVLGMGSFASLPVLLSAYELKIPIFLHDGNARVGKANRLLSRVAKLIGTAFPAVNSEKVKCPCIHSGMPVRPELEKQVKLTQNQALEQLNTQFEVTNGPLTAERPTLLVFGGSQGAAIFNEVVPQALKKLAVELPFQVLHLTGKGKLDNTLRQYEGAAFPRIVLETDQRMEYFLAAADLVISRSGGSTVAELALFGLPAVLIPYPFAAEGHQTDNANYYAQSGAGVVVANADFTVDKALEILRSYLQDRELLQKMHRLARPVARPGAAAEFLKLIRQKLAKLPR